MQSGQERPHSYFTNPFQPSQSAQHYPMEDVDGYDRYDQPLTLGGNRTNITQNPLGQSPEEVVLDFMPNSNDVTTNPRTNVTDREPATTTATILDVTDPNVPLQQYDPITDQNILENIIKSILAEVVKWNIFNVSVFILILSALKWKFSYISVLVLLWLYNAYNVFILSRASAVNLRRDKWINLFEIFNNLLSAIFKVIIVVQIETSKVSLIAPLTPLLLSELSLSLVKHFKNRRNCASAFYKVEIVFKVFIILQAVIFALKVDNIITWNWREVFCIYWILFAVMIGITFAFVIMLIGKCCTYLFAEMEVYEVRGVLWLVGVIGGKTILSYMLVRRTLKVLNNERPIENLIGVMATIAVYSLGVALYTGFFFKGIEDLWRKVAAIGVTFTEEDLSSGEKEVMTPKKEPEKIDIPKFLTKFSGTYFRRSTSEEIQKVKDSKKKKENEDAKENKSKNNPNKAPNKNRRRQNSLDTSKSKTTYMNNTTHLNLLTVPETEGERTKTTIEWNNTSRFGLRADKGKDFFASITDRSGVSGIIPSSSAINSKTDRYQLDAKDFSAMTSNDSYILPPTSKDTEVPTKFVRPNKERPIPGQTPEGHSPVARGDIMEESFEGSLAADPHFRRVQSMQDISPPHVISLSEALESPKVRNSVRIEHPEPLMSPNSEGSKEVQCLICFDNLPDAVFMECGHGGVCYECSLEIWKTTGECYLCRNKINQVLQVDIKTKLANNVIKVLSSTQMVLYDEDME